MKVTVEPGRYVLAVSGGVDSIVLLDLLHKMPKLKLIVAHFNHGIRSGGAMDEEFVRQTAKRLNFEFEAGQGQLGSQASEQAARHARYNFLFDVQKKYKAEAVITAHHQDDLIETAFINLIRGTGHRGLAAISSNKNVIRPLLNYSKAQIVAYAKQNQLVWKEDITNQEDLYLRNYLRRNVIKPKPGARGILIKNIDKVANLSKDIDAEIAKLSQNISKQNIIDRGKFALLPSSLGNELLIYWLRQQNAIDYNKSLIDRLNTAIRTYKSNTTCPATGKTKLIINQKTAYFSSTL